jgi:uncharacterized iron-regulated membrane protein
MGAWQQWVRQPQSVWLRKAIFQIHLWTGLAIGLYVTLLSVTGAALVYRVEMERAFQTPRPAFEPGRTPLSSDELKAFAQRAYPDWQVTRVGSRVTRRNPVIEVWVERGGEKRERLFNPYTGADLGDALPLKVRALDWLSELHDELLLDEQGRVINAVGSAMTTLLALTGLVIWWPGIRNWRRSLMVKRRSNWTRFNWDLHSALGIWFSVFLLMWGLTGIYLAYPEPFAAYVDRISPPDAILGQRPGDIVLATAARLHFGRFRTAPVWKALWVPLGLVPAAMFITGGVMWWNRVMRRKLMDRAA